MADQSEFDRLNQPGKLPAYLGQKARGLRRILRQGLGLSPPPTPLPPPGLPNVSGKIVTPPTPANGVRRKLTTIIGVRG